MGERRTSRRAPAPDERQRDAERSRQQLLAAALDEFAASGYAGARVADIAHRAGVNKQLIAYYFGGKEGLYRALHEAWLDQEAGFARPDVPFEQLIAKYVHASLADPRMTRLLIWDGLTGIDSHDGREVRAEASDEHPDVADVRRRQATGEIPPDLDPAVLLLAMFGAVIAPIALPQIARRMGIDVDSREFVGRYADQLARMAGHLSP